MNRRTTDKERPVMSTIAIIGAGVSGLAAAHTLQDAGYTVTLFEKSRGVGGRAATRKRDGFIYDHGAQYIRGGSQLSDEWITKRFATPDLLSIEKPVWTFDAAGHIQEGDAKQNAEPRWTYRSGLTTLSKRMAEGLDIHLETRIGRVQHTLDGWLLFDTGSQNVGHFDQLLITIPATQAIELLQSSQLDDNLSQTLSAQLNEAQYNPLISVMLGYRPRPQERPYYALVNTDKGHPISWLAWEHEKSPERVPSGTGLLIAQTAPQYSKQHRETPQTILFQDVQQLVSQLLHESLPELIFTDVQYWKYALPSSKANADTLNALALQHGFAFCGDAFVGGRVHLALEDGIKVAQQIIDL